MFPIPERLSHMREVTQSVKSKATSRLEAQGFRAFFLRNLAGHLAGENDHFRAVKYTSTRGNIGTENVNFACLRYGFDVGQNSPHNPSTLLTPTSVGTWPVVGDRLNRISLGRSTYFSYGTG
jgi:hypothetical protein